MTADVLFPTSAAEAATLYGDGADITVVGGGTILLPEIAAGRVRPERALMLHRTGLDALRVDGDRVVIGAMVPIAALLDSPDRSSLRRRPPHRGSRSARERDRRRQPLGSRPEPTAQRGDLGAPLIALGARVRSTGAGGERIEAVEDFLTGDRSRRLVLEIEYDRFERRTGAAGPPAPARPLVRDRGCRRLRRTRRQRPTRRRLRRRSDRRPLPQCRSKPRRGRRARRRRARRRRGRVGGLPSCSAAQARP